MSMGKFLGQAVETEPGRQTTGHLFDLYENGYDHADACPCVNFLLPGQVAR